MCKSAVRRWVRVDRIANICDICIYIYVCVCMSLFGIWAKHGPHFTTRGSHHRFDTLWCLGNPVTYQNELSGINTVVVVTCIYQIWEIYLLQNVFSSILKYIYCPIAILVRSYIFNILKTFVFYKKNILHEETLRYIFNWRFYARYIFCHHHISGW